MLKLSKNVRDFIIIVAKKLTIVTLLLAPV